MECYICHSNRHFARDCIQPQQFSRCAVCNSVCTSSNSHKNWCTNRDFVSRLLQPGATVFKTKIIAEIGFQNVNNVRVMDNGCEMPIDETPLFVSNAHLMVFKSGKRIALASYVSDKNPTHVNIFDEHNNAVMHAEIGKRSAIVNERYRINGEDITCKAASTERIIDKKQLRIKVNSNDMFFRIRLFLDDNLFEFVVCPTGTIYVDPLMRKYVDEMRCGKKLRIFASSYAI